MRGNMGLKWYKVAGAVSGVIVALTFMHFKNKEPEMSPERKEIRAFMEWWSKCV